jgi:CheY-like chemotaxis protein
MPPSAGTPRVLVVDDSELFRAAVCELLDVSGLDLAADVGTAEDALSLLGHGLEVELVVMDVQLPGLSGATAADHIARRHPALPVLLTSALDERDLGTLTERRGARTFVPKSALDGDALWRALLGDGGAGTPASENRSP